MAASLPSETDHSTVDNTSFESLPLPEIGMPEFTGEELLDWIPFWDLFTAIMDGQPINEAYKLLYLRGSLKGEALELVSGYLITNENYAHAVAKLKKRYGNVPDNTSRGSSPNHIVLPGVPIPEFSGEPATWPWFWSAFTAIFESHPIKDAHKLIYLRQYLKGEASSCIAYYPLTDENYKLCVEKLKERYGSDSRIESELYRQLNGLEPASNSLKSVRKFADKLAVILLKLEQLGTDVNNMFTRLSIEEKLPTWMRQKLVEAKFDASEPRTSGNGAVKWNTKALQTELEKILRIKEEVDRIWRSGRTGSAGRGNQNNNGHWRGGGNASAAWRGGHGAQLPRSSGRSGGDGPINNSSFVPERVFSGVAIVENKKLESRHSNHQPNNLLGIESDDGSDSSATE